MTMSKMNSTMYCINLFESNNFVTDITDNKIMNI